MANKHLLKGRTIRCEPVGLLVEAEYREWPGGVEITVETGSYGSSRVLTRVIRIPWSKLRKSLKRKDRE